MKADAALRGDQPRQRKAERRLARAGFADDAECLACAQRQIDAVDGLHMIDDLAQESGLDREPDLHVRALPSPIGFDAIGQQAARRVGSEASRWRV